MLGKETGRFENQKTNRDLPNYSIVKIDQNSRKGPGYLLSLRLRWETFD